MFPEKPQLVMTVGEYFGLYYVLPFALGICAVYLIGLGLINLYERFKK